jgi:Na+/H+ antiporter NhaC
MLSESLLCFGASSTTMDDEDAFENSDEVVTFNLIYFCYFVIGLSWMSIMFSVYVMFEVEDNNDKEAINGIQIIFLASIYLSHVKS